MNLSKNEIPSRVQNIIGHVFGSLTIIGYAGSMRTSTGKKKGSAWLCKCVCGKVLRRAATSLRYKLLDQKTISCGCQNHGCIKHGLFGTKQYALWYAAKQRATKSGLPFSLKPEDIIIPSKCPVLGISILPAHGKPNSNSPSIDRIKGHRGYTKKNIRVISFRANALKSNATFDELIKVANYVRSTA